MFRKKQTPPVKTGRNVRPQQAANVFSYHANRSSSGDVASERRMGHKTETKKRRNGREWLAFLPSAIAGFALLLCVSYILSLDTNAKLQVVGDQRESGLLVGIEEYEIGVQEAFDSSLANKSKLLINTDELANKLREKYPELGEIAIVLPLVGRRPIVQVQPAKPALILGTASGGYVVDETGRIIADAESVASSIRDRLPTLQDESGLQLERGKYALSTDVVELASEVAAQFSEKGVKIQTMTLPIAPHELHVRVSGLPYYIKFNTKGEGRVQAGSYIATKQKLEADTVIPSQYIDVRVEGRVFYK